VQQIIGNVTVSLHRGSIRAQDIKGDVAVDGRISDTTVNDVTGSVSLSGDFFGSMTLARINKGVTFHSSRTDMEMGALPGDLNLESGDLRARAVAGPLRLITRSKDIHIEDVTGDLKIENSNGMVEYHAGNKLGQVDITNTRGDVQLTFPPKVSFQLNAQARRGDIETEFEGISVNADRNDHSAKGSIGNGGPDIRISNTNGDISLRKGPVPPPPENADAPQKLPPDRTVTPGGGVSDKPPKAPRAPKAATPPPSTTTDLRWRLGPRGPHMARVRLHGAL
jgi:hypothetical protein